jgi:WD40 repeat protein
MKNGAMLNRLTEFFYLSFFALQLAGPLFGQMKLREELINRQQEGGYVLASFGHGSVYIANFSRRDDWSEDTKLPPPADHVQDGLLSPDGKLIALFFQDFSSRFRFWLGIIGRDGSGLRDYPGIESAYCWSPDSRRLIVQQKSPQGTYRSMLLERESGQATEIDVPPRASFTSQCWSPDGQQLAYHLLDREPTRWTPENSKKKEPPNLGTVFIYDIEQKKRQELGRGQDATWSPDGNWIAYWNAGAAWRVKPSGEARQRLFKRKEPESPLVWSPDSRLVLYFHCCYLAPSLRCMCDVGRDYVRRLSDHSEVRVGEGSPGSHTDVWIKGRGR